MAIEQSKVPSNEARSHATKSAAFSARSKAAAQDAQAGMGFAAVLASTDVSVEPATTEATAVAQNTPSANAAAKRGHQAERGTQAADKKDGGHKAQTAEADGCGKFTDQDQKNADQADRDLLAVTVVPPLPEVMALAVDGAAALVQDAVSADNTLPHFAVVGGGRGGMRTGQLQQALAMASDKVVGARALSGGGVRVPGDGDVADEATSGAAMAFAQDFRANAMGKTLAVSDAALDSGARMMSLMVSVATHAEFGARSGSERRGQDEAHGGVIPAQDVLDAEFAGMAGQAPAGFSMEDAPVQETVRYWVGADTKQQAQLTVADVAGGSVDVTIHMHGKDAQVSFRADEQQARDALQASSSQLKNMLGQEGLTLSSLSVGTSSAGQEGRQEHRPERGPGKTTKVTAAGGEPVLAPARGSVQGVPGRGSTLDLFV